MNSIAAAQILQAVLLPPGLGKILDIGKVLVSPCRFFIGLQVS
jgi:hypothetical protein